VSEEYTDNFFLAGTNKEWDWNLIIRPKVSMRVRMQNAVLNLGVGSEHQRPSEHNDYDDNRYYAQAGIKFKTPAGFSGGIDGKFRDWSNPPSYKGDEIKDFIDYKIGLNLARSFADYWGVGLRYTHVYKRFDRGVYAIDDLNQDGVALEASYRPLPQTSIFLEGGYDWNRFPERDNPSWDNNVYRLWIGLRSSPRAKIVGEIKGGASYKQWDNENLSDPILYFGAEGKARYQPNKKTRLTASLFRRAVDQTFTVRDADPNAAYHIDTGFSFRAYQKFIRQVSGYVDLRYKGMEYMDRDDVAGGDSRLDFELNFSVGLDFRIHRHLKLGVQGGYLDHTSNVDGGDYQETRGLVYISGNL